jgi:hypothetical protein
MSLYLLSNKLEARMSLYLLSNKVDLFIICKCDLIFLF